MEELLEMFSTNLRFDTVTEKMLVYVHLVSVLSRHNSLYPLLVMC